MSWPLSTLLESRKLETSTTTVLSKPSSLLFLIFFSSSSSSFFFYVLYPSLCMEIQDTLSWKLFDLLASFLEVEMFPLGISNSIPLYLCCISFLSLSNFFAIAIPSVGPFHPNITGRKPYNFLITFF